MGQQRPAEWYDNTILKQGRHEAAAEELGWYDLWKEVASLVPEGADVVDLGCGCGHFGQVLWGMGKTRDYIGFDFSQEAIKSAKRRDLPYRFICADVTDEDFEIPAASVYVMTEFLEHVEGDIELLKRLPFGSLLLVSVPTFDSAAHVRHFPDRDKALWRYEPFMAVDEEVTLKDNWHILTGHART